MDKGGNEGPKGAEQPAHTGQRPEDGMQNPRCDVKQQPGCAKNDGLHRVKTNERIALFQKPEDESPDQREARQRGGDIGWQASGGRSTRVMQRWLRRWRRRARIDWIGHNEVRHKTQGNCQVNSEKIEISSNSFRYDIFVNRDIMKKAGELTRHVLTASRCAIIADENSGRLFGSRICDTLRARQFQPILITIPAGESSKSLAQVERVCNQMIASNLDRTSFVVGLGGGVVGDLSGFVSAIFERGIPHIQIPTTLLAMVDSAIGGKTGVNLEGGKNLIGAFHHPLLVLVDIDALDSLPPQELRQGYAEIIKHGVIGDAEMIRALSSESLPRLELIRRNISLKAQMVSADDRDVSGQRALLNFGHTIGHAIERASDFKLRHGDCVSLGITAACHISVKRAGLTLTERDEVVDLLEGFGLPTRLPAGISRREIAKAVHRDKKFEDGRIRFVVTPKLGSARISDDVTMEDIAEAIAKL